jgi:hypothetical protein
VNAAYDLTYDPQARNMVKSDALWIRGKTEGELTASRLGINVRGRVQAPTRTFAFAQNQYLRDEFKSIDYLLAPGGGVGFKLFDTMQTKLAVDAGSGRVGGNPDSTCVLGARDGEREADPDAHRDDDADQSVAALWKTKTGTTRSTRSALGVAARSRRARSSSRSARRVQEPPPPGPARTTCAC